MSDAVVAGIELGGTKVCLVLGRGTAILDRARIATANPDDTLAATVDQLARWQPQALGIGSFGPIALHPESPAFGRMLDTPKPGWAGIDVLRRLGSSFGSRVAIHTDVTAAALAEGVGGAAKGLTDYVYMTVGTGIGMGVIAGGLPLVGVMHPEAGHMRIPRVNGDDFGGACSFHGDCLEGLAAGPAIARRMGCPGHAVGESDPRWMFVADALAQACANLFLTLLTERIVLGGGVGVGQLHLLPEIRRRTAVLLAGYLPGFSPEEMTQRIVPAALGEDAGPLGTLELARIALRREAARH